MGKFNFNHVTEEARGKLEKSHIRVEREENGTWSIFTNDVDFLQDELAERNIDVAEYANVKERIRMQGLRHWYCEDTGRYYYLIEENVYQSWKKTIKDYRFNPPTTFVETLFDYMPDPGSIEDILRARYPSFDGHHAFY